MHFLKALWYSYAVRFFTPVIIISGIVIYISVTHSVVDYQRAAPGGDVEAGKQAIRRYGCGSCHVIEGIADADSDVGPPLVDYGQRSYIAGKVPNTASNLIAWIMNPHQIEPGTAMPNLGITEQEARDIAAYLYSQSD